MAVFDEYVLKARIAPLALVALPPSAALVSLALHGDTVVGWGGLSLVALSLLAASDAVRSAGRRHEAARWAERGGSPTVRALLAQSSTGEDRRQRVHRHFALRVEVDVPESAERAAEALRQKARAEPNPARSVAAANANYGRMRHLVVLRPLGLATSLGTAVWCLLRLGNVGGVVARTMGTMHRSHAGLIASLAIAVALLWWRFVTDQTLDDLDNIYTTRLMGYLDSLPRGIPESE